MKSGHVVSEVKEQTDRQTDRHTDTLIAMLRTQIWDEVIVRIRISTIITCSCIFHLAVNHNFFLISCYKKVFSHFTPYFKSKTYTELSFNVCVAIILRLHDNNRLSNWLNNRLDNRWYV